MIANRLSPAYDSLLDFIVEKVSPQEMLAFKATEDEQARADELTEKNKAGSLTPEEAAELEQMMEADMIVTLLKARAMVALEK